MTVMRSNQLSIELGAKVEVRTNLDDEKPQVGALAIMRERKRRIRSRKEPH